MEILVSRLVTYYETGDLVRFLDSFRFDPRITIDAGEVTAKPAHLGLLGFGETFEEAMEDLVEELRIYTRDFFERASFYAETDRAGDILRAGSPVPLLGPPVLLGEQVRPVPDPEHADPLGALELVRAEGHQGLDVDAIRDHLESIGESVLVAGDSRALKVHVHNERPDLVIGYGLTLGNMSRPDLLLTLALAARCVPRATVLTERDVNAALKDWLAGQSAQPR